ncbi:MAG: hypothetical protein GXP14_00215 [Gammaproteobacteria bacterium]|nr:hypothetical protein [Gammaproteobacteria bacterium]
MPKTTNQFQLKPLSIAVLATALLVSLPTHAVDKARITASTDVKPVTILSAQESQALSLAAGRILLHTDKARLAIAREDKSAALNEIDQGLTLVNVIQNAMPKYKVTTKIEAGDITYNADDKVSKNFVAIFDEQYIEDVTEPVIQSKKKAQARNTAKPGDGKITAKEGEKKTIAPLENFTMWRHSSMRLNITLAADALNLAKIELNKGKNHYADSALALLQSNGVVFELHEMEMPLVEAADNLKLAELEISEGKSEEARITLKLASDDLKKYERITGENRAKEVRKLHQKIDNLSESLEKGDGSKSTLEAAKKEIASYWNRVRKWFK